MADAKMVVSTAEVVKDIVQAVPVYQDVVQPAAREVGVALQTLARTIHVALAPVAALVWGYDQIKEFVAAALLKRLTDVPPERLTTPPPTVAGPILEALRFAGHDPTLRELYANLLATSLDAASARNAHPAYVEVIKQLTPDEARILALFAPKGGHSFPLVSVRANIKSTGGYVDVLRNFSLLPEQALCAHPELGETYIDNICRLGLAHIPAAHLTNGDAYAVVEKHHQVEAAKMFMQQDPDFEPEIVRRVLQVTALGKQFCGACVAEQGAG